MYVQNFCAALKRVRTISEKRLLASSCPSVRLSQYISEAPAGRIFVQYYIGNFFRKPRRQIQDLLKIGRRYRMLCVKTDGTTKCCVGRRQFRHKPLLCFHVNSEPSYIVKAPCCSTTIQRGRIIALTLQ